MDTSLATGATSVPSDLRRWATTLYFMAPGATLWQWQRRRRLARRRRRRSPGPNPAGIIYGTALSRDAARRDGERARDLRLLAGGGHGAEAGNDTLSVTFTPTDTTDYTTATATATIAVAQATPTITWATRRGSSTARRCRATQLDATASVAGTFTYSPAAGTVLKAGNDTLSVTFTPTDTDRLHDARRRRRRSRWRRRRRRSPGPTRRGSSTARRCRATQLDATASVPGTFAYSPAAGTVPRRATTRCR